MKTRLFVIAAWLGLGLLPALGAEQYERDWNTNGFHVLELREDSAATPLFSVVRIEYTYAGESHIRIYIPADSRDAVRAALDSGRLTAEISSPDGGDPVAASLTLYRSCLCTGGESAVVGVYRGQTCADRCGAEGVVEEEYYLKVYTRLYEGEELAIGWEPDQLWMVERE